MGAPSNVRVQGMISSVGSRGEVKPIALNADTPMMFKVTGYDAAVSKLYGYFAFDGSQRPIVADVVVDKAGGQGPASTICKLEAGDMTVVFRNKTTTPVATDPDNIWQSQWLCPLKGGGVECPTPIVVTRMVLSNDCSGKASDENTDPEPPVDPDNLPISVCYWEPNRVGYKTLLTPNNDNLLYIQWHRIPSLQPHTFRMMIDGFVKTITVCKFGGYL